MNPDIKKAFTHIYDIGGWHVGETNDGTGSTTLFAQDIIGQLPGLLNRWKINTLFDAGCGEFTWMRHLDLSGIRYIGADVITAKIEKLKVDFPQHVWLEIDVTEDPLPAADLWMCRDTMIHFPRSHIAKTLENFLRSDITYLLVGHHECGNSDIREFGGINHINWNEPPFSMPLPLETISDSNRKMLLFNKEQVSSCGLLSAS